MRQRLLAEHPDRPQLKWVTVSRLPTGIVTFLFTDIEGSTRRWEHAPDAMSGALARHDALIEAAVAGQGGAIYKTIGDAFQIAFAEPGQALAAAVIAQRLLAAEDWAAFGQGSGQEIGPVRVRMALHTAPAEPTGSDYRTPQLNRVARLLAAGHGGQVLLTAATQTALGDGLPRGIRLRPLGTHRLKDLREPETIYQASAEGMPEVPLPLRTAGPVAPHDRIVVLEGPVSGGDAGRPVDQALADLGAVLRGEAESVTFSPQEIRGLVMHRPADLTEYRLIRIAEWSQPRYRLDDRFVGLTLLVDQGEEAAHGRWEPAAERFDDLRALLAATEDPALVVLGPPGSGKSTLLRHLEIELASEALRGGGSALTWFVPLSQFPNGPPDDPTDPADWLAARWRGRYPALPPLDTLLAGGRMLLLLDGLNEIGSGSDAGFRACVRRWQRFVAGLAGDLPGNRVLFSCRSLDYSAPLSTAALRVPQVRIEPMDDAQVRAFLEAYAPAYAAEFWRQLVGQPTLALMRIPYLASLAIEQVARSGSPPDGVAELLTGFVRRALRREIEIGNPLLEPDSLLTARDVRQIVQSSGWRTPFELPQRGLLVPKLSELAYAMQSGQGASGWANNGSNHGTREQVRLNYARTQDVLDHPRGEAILRAGLDLGVLDEDPASDEVMYFHQLVQEYFSARRTADRPDFGLVRAEWRAAALRPPLAELRAGLPPAESLPPLPTTGWEETFGLAAPMAEDAEGFVRALADVNLVLAGRCAASAELRGRLSTGLLDSLRQALAARTRDPAADLRARLAAGLALGPLGDPRLALVRGPFGDYRLPPMVAIPGGTYPIGDDAPFTYIQQIWTDHLPRHPVTLAPVGSSRVDLQACKLEYSIVSPK